MKKKIICLLLTVVMLMSSLLAFTACKRDKDEPVDAFVIMTENLDGLFNPFFSTSATDGTIVSMTQIGMLSSKYVNGEAEVAYGDSEAVVTKDFAITTNEDGDSVYTFVIKNGILFSDGHPLTIEDVLFNLYVYLDPVYTGSATIYSTAIKGLNAYRTQNPDATEDDNDDTTGELASANANARIMELVQLYTTAAEQSDGSYSITPDEMRAAIKAHSPSYDYMASIMTDAEMEEDGATEKARAQLLKDYENTLEKFKNELNTDFESAKDAYTESPYKEHSEFENDIFCFFFAEGYVQVEYAKKPGTNADDKSKIEKLTPDVEISNYTTKEAAVTRVYNDMLSEALNSVLLWSVTAQELRNEFTAKAKEVIIHNQIDGDELAVPSISGIVSLGHTAAHQGSVITVNGNEYTVATTHDANGVPTDGYDVLEITVDGVDPKAQWNFAFTVAPQHYYGEGANTAVDIANDKFGVDYGSFDFMKGVIQSVRNIKLPMGAGAYKVTDRSNSDTPSANGFYTDGVVYFKANNNFHTVGSGLNNAKIEKVRYQVVSASNAIGALQEGSVHYVTPQLTGANMEKLSGMRADGFEYLMADNLGYGYIGVNATHIPNINIRKAIMCAMNTTLALDYYDYPDSASQIYWPMSKVSWAYPKGNAATDNGKDYPQLGEKWNETVAKDNIQKYMDAAGVSAGDKELTVKFTIAGSNLQEHPTYKVFRDAAALLNDMGWDVTVEADTQALTKINTGALEVWAAAWGSTIDPDMYQVYHKNSTATSTIGWGYSEIKRDEEQKAILDDLSDLIDAARETDDRATRTELYKLAMGKVLDLAVELPVYQRKNLYAYNSNVLKTESLPSEINPYSSPLDRIWELELNN